MQQNSIMKLWQVEFSAYMTQHIQNKALGMANKKVREVTQ
jgi:hypothetical protein